MHAQEGAKAAQERGQGCSEPPPPTDTDPEQQPRGQEETQGGQHPPPRRQTSPRWCSCSAWLSHTPLPCRGSPCYRTCLWGEPASRSTGGGSNPNFISGGMQGQNEVCPCPPWEGIKCGFALRHGWTLKTYKVRGASHERPHIIGFTLQETLRIGKSIATETRLPRTGETGNAVVVGGGSDHIFEVMKMF